MVEGRINIAEDRQNANDGLWGRKQTEQANERAGHAWITGFGNDRLFELNADGS